MPAGAQGTRSPLRLRPQHVALAPLFKPNRCYQFRSADGTLCRVRFGASTVDARGYVVGTDVDCGVTVYPLAHGRCTRICDITTRSNGLSVDHSRAKPSALSTLDELAAA